MSSELILLDNLKYKLVTVNNAKDNRSGMGKSANLSYDNKRFSMVLSDVRFPFGASAKKEEYRTGDKDQWSLQCELTEEQIQILKDLDEHIVDSCLSNESITNQFLVKGKKPSREVLDSKYISCLKYSKKDGKVNDQYPPTLRLNIPNDKGSGFTTSFFRSSPQGSQLAAIDNVPGSENNIAGHLLANTRGSVLVGVSIWLTASSFGLAMRLNQIKTEPGKQLDRGVCLLDKLLQSGENNYQTVEDPGHLTEEEEVSEEVPVEVEVEEEVEDQLEDDMEEVEEEVDVPTPPIKKAAVKRVAKKVTA